MNIDLARRKLKLAEDREREKHARAQDKLDRANRNHSVATRQINESQRRVRYFQERRRELDASELAAEGCP